MALIHNARQVLTMCEHPNRDRRHPPRLGVIEDGAVLIESARIARVGTQAELFIDLADDVELIDAEQNIVLPGFVDPHTHLVFSGSRPAEFEARLLNGTNLVKLVQAGHGSLETVERTRRTKTEDLVDLVEMRLRRMLVVGTTSVEIKTGYGLSVDEELRHLRVIDEASRRVPVNVLRTALVAHFRPPELADRPDEWVDAVCRSLIPAIAAERLADAIDVFLEPSVFDRTQCTAILECGQRYELPCRVHGDQFADDGAAELAAEFGALSADHLGFISARGIGALAQSGTVAVLIPGSLVFMPGERPAPVREMIDAGVTVALATDYNPGSSPIVSQALSAALALVFLKMTVAETLAAITIDAAAAIGRRDSVGSIEPGKSADLVFIEATDYRDILYRFGENLVRRVISAGTTVVNRPLVGPL